MKKSEFILVTGGEGFIGRYVCSKLIAQGKKVISLDQNILNRSTGRLTYKCDIANRDQLEQIFKAHSFTQIVHLASLLNTASRKNPKSATLVNIGGSLNILEAACKFHVPRVIYGSSISVYGSKLGLGQEGVLETDSAVPEDIYGVAKRYVEILGDIYNQKFGIQFIALRISSVVGPGAIATSSRWRSDIFEKLGLPHKTKVSIPYRKDEMLPLVYVEDVADMFGRLVDAEQVSFSVYNTPSEVWRLGELKRYLESLDKNIQITFGQSSISGIPRIINGQRFMTEFKYAPTSLKKRLRFATQL